MEIKMKKIAIIGANSYIARNLIYVLNDKECNLQLYDCADNHADGIKNYSKINILDESSVERIDFDCDIVYFFVGKTGSENGFDNYSDFIDINEKALLNFLSAYKRARSTAKIVFPSTRLVYKGRSGLLKEEAEKEFRTVYAINKFACEKYLEQFNNVYGIPYCIVRICVPYGTIIRGASSYGTAEFMMKCASDKKNITLYGDGSVRRTVIYIGDLCNVLAQIGFSDKCINDVYNIGGEDYSLREMADLIAKRYGVEIEYIPYPSVAEKIESGDTVFDDSKLRSRIDISYKMCFSEWCLR